MNQTTSLKPNISTHLEPLAIFLKFPAIFLHRGLNCLQYFPLAQVEHESHTCQMAFKDTFISTVILLLWCQHPWRPEETRALPCQGTAHRQSKTLCSRKLSARADKINRDRKELEALQGQMTSPRKEQSTGQIPSTAAWPLTPAAFYCLSSSLIFCEAGWNSWNLRHCTQERRNSEVKRPDY